MCAIVVVVNVLVILIVMLDMANAVHIPRVQIRADMMLFHKSVLVVVQFVTLTRFALVTKMSV